MKMMDVRRIFVDTNVLIYSTNASSPWQSIAAKALEKARIHKIELVLSYQILREYLASATRISVIGTEVTLQEIVENVRMFQAQFTLLEEKASGLAKLIDLIQEIPTAGKQIHDANIVATMLVNGVDFLLTYNKDDFKRFSQKIHLVSLEEWVNSNTDQADEPDLR
jgi:predicted nucleic acid-binding protein